MERINKRLTRKDYDKLNHVKQAKVYEGLADEFAKIASIRFINGLDKRPSPPTVQRKALKHPLWCKIRADLEIAEFINEKDLK